MHGELLGKVAVTSKSIVYPTGEGSTVVPGVCGIRAFHWHMLVPTATANIDGNTKIKPITIYAPWFLHAFSKVVFDFISTMQPSMRLLEIPVATKTITILDHPRNPASAIPFHMHDTSNKIGLDVEYREFEKLPYPPCLTET